MIAEVVSALAIVISLIYLASQIRQNTAQSKLISSQAVDTSKMQAFDPIYIPENSVIWTKGHADPDVLTDHESHMFNMLMARVLLASFNTISYHYVSGALPEELYKMDAEYFATLVTTPGGARWYRDHRSVLHRETQNRLDQVQNKKDNPQ